MSLLRSAHLKLEMGETLQGLELVKKVMPYLLSRGCIETQGHCHYMMSLCLIAQDGPDFDRARRYLDCAIECTFQDLIL